MFSEVSLAGQMGEWSNPPRSGCLVNFVVSQDACVRTALWSFIFFGPFLTFLLLETHCLPSCCSTLLSGLTCCWARHLEAGTVAAFARPAMRILRTVRAPSCPVSPGSCCQNTWVPSHTQLLLQLNLLHKSCEASWEHGVPVLGKCFHDQ